MRVQHHASLINNSQRGAEEQKKINIMKVQKLLILFATVTVLMIGCEEEDGYSGGSSQGGGSNGLIGTTWTAPYADHQMVLKFISSSKCEAYFADGNLNYVRGATQGTYSVSGNNVTFSGMDLVWIYAHNVLKKGTYSGSFLKTTGETYYVTSSGEGSHSTWTETWSKR